MDFSRYKIKKSGGTIETNEVFLDSLAKKREEELGLTEKRFEVKIKERLIYSIFGLFLFILGFLFGVIINFHYLNAVFLPALIIYFWLYLKDRKKIIINYSSSISTL